MLVRVIDSIDGVGLRLSGQTTPGFEMQDMLWRAAIWAPKKAKSFTVSHFRLTDYHGGQVAESIGFARCYVLYYSTKPEGEYLVESYTDRKQLDDELFAAYLAKQAETESDR